ncbi:MAG: DUF86 domain-containing protein [Bacteroidetes bacterium]|nr:DUF86 domain-containing protein [Bacteroidota bacterium]MBU1678827.1 DUF86 domain-containing protein [Bacteroidota bacterium]MBU2508374.1 DUF86 domain-containing protein [Bacteroidota bacterium]
MYDKEIVIEILKNIEWSIRVILKRSNEINSYEDFIKDDEGLTKLDSICMQFINIGEALKEIDKITSNKLLINYPGIDWKAAKGMRDVITHHYFDIDAEIVFETIQDKLPQLQKTINSVIMDLTVNDEKST